MAIMRILVEEGIPCHLQALLPDPKTQEEKRTNYPRGPVLSLEVKYIPEDSRHPFRWQGEANTPGMQRKKASCVHSTFFSELSRNSGGQGDQLEAESCSNRGYWRRALATISRDRAPFPRKLAFQLVLIHEQ